MKIYIMIYLVITSWTVNTITFSVAINKTMTCDTIGMQLLMCRYYIYSGGMMNIIRSFVLI